MLSDACQSRFRVARANLGWGHFNRQGVADRPGSQRSLGIPLMHSPPAVHHVPEVECRIQATCITTQGWHSDSDSTMLCYLVCRTLLIALVDRTALPSFLIGRHQVVCWAPTLVSDDLYSRALGPTDVLHWCICNGREFLFIRTTIRVDYNGPRETVPLMATLYMYNAHQKML